MVNKTNKKIVREDRAMFLVLMLELVVIICLAVNLLIMRHPGAPADGGDDDIATIGRKSCNPKDYKAFNDRVFYYPGFKEADEHLLSTFSDDLTTNYPDSEIKALIEGAPVGPDGLAIIRGYQIVNGVVLEDTFFAVDVDESGHISAFPAFINPDQIKLDGLMEESKAEDVAYSAIEVKAKQEGREVKGACSYEMFFTDSDNGVINKPASGFYYQYIFNFSDNEENSFPKGYVYLDGKTGEILDSLIDDGIRT